MTRTPYVCDGSGRQLVEADEYEGPDVLYVWQAPHPLFGPRSERRKQRGARRKLRRSRVESR